MDDEHGALFGRQAMKTSIQLVAHSGHVLGVAVAAGVRSGHVDLHDRAMLDPPGLPIAGMDEQPMQPGIEAVGVPDGANVQPRGKERLLDSIGRQVVTSQDEPRGSVQPIERIGGERREGVVVAIPRAKDEVSLHRIPGSWRPDGRSYPS